MTIIDKTYHINEPSSFVSPEKQHDRPVDERLALWWGLDFWRAFYRRPIFIKWLCKILMGRYAWNELCGLKRSIEDCRYSTTTFYGCETVGYHKELDQYKEWK